VAGERGGLPLAVILSAANANDSTMFEAVLEDIPPIRMPSGRRRRRPGKVHADKAYDHRRCRAYLRRRGIRPRIARRMVESSQRLGRHRWTIERTGAWLGGFRRLRIRYERNSERFYALAMLACSVICFNALQRPPWRPFRNVHLSGPRVTVLGGEFAGVVEAVGSGVTSFKVGERVRIQRGLMGRPCRVPVDARGRSPVGGDRGAAAPRC
jgi:transposase